jgi:glycosyltransferase involved in cell wall biosynthesis
MIKVLFLSSTDNLFGAAKATFKLFRALQKRSLNLHMLVKKKVTNEPTVEAVAGILPLTFHVKFDNFVLDRYKGPKRNNWTLAILPNWGLQRKLRTLSYDIVQLNWIGAGFVPIRLLSHIRKPIVWRLSDSWAFTGGCHIPEGCLKYETGCGACPQLNSVNNEDVSRTTIIRKQQSWEKLDMTIVAPSRWMADNARRSLLFRNRNIVHIPTGVNTDIFTPMDREQARRKHGFSVEQHIILFGAFSALTDPNKGFHLLVKALEQLAKIHPDPRRVVLAVFGQDESGPPLNLKFETKLLGHVSDMAKLNEYYNAADVYVLPSLMENSPNTVVESLGAGTPVVAFDACGTTELVEHKIDGYLAQAYSTDDLADGLMHFLSPRNDAEVTRKAARGKILSKYDIVRVADQYNELYASIKNRANQ